MGNCGTACASRFAVTDEKGDVQILADFDSHFTKTEGGVQIVEDVRASTGGSLADVENSAASTEAAHDQMKSQVKNDGNAAAARIFEALDKSSATSIDLSSVCVFLNQQDLGAEWIASALQKNTTLTSIDLTGNNIYHNGAKMIGQALERNTNLLHIALSKNVIGPEGAPWIGSALQKNSTLMSVELAWNHLGAAGAKHICAALHNNYSITRIDLSGNMIKAGISFVAQVLEQNPTLVSIELRGNRIGDTGAERIGQALAKNATLTRINLASNHISDIGTQCIGEAIRQNSALVNIDLCKNCIGDSGAGELHAALAKNMTITSLDLDENAVSDSMLEIIDAALEKNMCGLRALTVWHLNSPVGEDIQFSCTNLAGEEVCCLVLASTEQLESLKKAIAFETGFLGHLRLLLPDSGSCQTSVSLEDVAETTELRSLFKAPTPSQYNTTS